MTYQANASTEQLCEKWNGVLENDKFSSITDQHRKKVTAVLLENTDKMLAEANTTTSISAQNTGGGYGFDPILISMIRRMAPKLIAYDIVGVQPLQMPTGLIFAMKARYGNDGTGAEAQGLTEADTDYAGAGTHLGSDPWLGVSYTTGTAIATGTAETATWAAMSMTIDKVAVTAKDRQLRADYSLSLQQDLKAIHGLDADTELANILSTEIISEVNREIVRNLYTIAKPGMQQHSLSTTTGTGDEKGIFNITADSDGRWSAERFKALHFAIEREANMIAYETRRGKGNFIVTSANVASALVIGGMLDYAPALPSGADLEIDVTGATYAGQMGRYKVYIDPYLSTDGFLVGYKGQSAYDAGYFYCPYTPLQMVRANDPTNFQPAIGFRTRYGVVANPFTTLTANSNTYYRKVKVVGL